MNKFKSTLKKRADRTEDLLKDLQIGIYKDINEVGTMGFYKTQGFLEPEAVRKKQFRRCKTGFQWERNKEKGEKNRLGAGESGADLTSGAELPADLSVGDSVWFNLDFSIPENMEGKPTYLKFAARPSGTPKMELEQRRPNLEALCYKNGEPWQAFDQGREELLLDKNARAESFDLLVEAGTTTLWGGLDVNEFTLEACGIYTLIQEVRELYLNVKLLNDLRKDIEEGKPRYDNILKSLNEARKVFPFQSDNSEELAEGARYALEKLEDVKESCSDLSDYSLETVGHAHIDTAWLWPWSETVRKTGRTFSNTLQLMEEYPELKFLQSQPHLYEFAKNRYPEVFSRIEEAVEEGKWDPTGAFWVECDVNISGGEAIARQYLMGKRYFRDEFDVDPKVTFIPDVFGYPPSLPSIAQAADCPYFFTQKLSWNEINEFPHHAFIWEGIDGSELLSHFLPTNTYSGRAEVEETRKAVNSFSEKDELNEIPYLIGWGDGGGGVTREMLDKVETMNEIEALPDIEFSSLKDFFEELDEKDVDLPRWVGELYLELHRGTLTTQADTKKNNRKAELGLREAEIWATTASIRKEMGYPRESLEKAWKITLFNQFHDILPGSSVREVYQDAERDYREVFKIVEEETDRALRDLTGEGDREVIRLRNSLSWWRDEVVVIDELEEKVNSLKDEDGNSYPVQESHLDGEALVDVADLPPLGTKTFEPSSKSSEPENEFEVSKKSFENSMLRLKFDGDGYLNSIFDKTEGREVLLEERKGNELRLYRDIPLRESKEAWDLDEDYYDVWESLPEAETRILEEGPMRAVISQKRAFNDSEIVQYVIMYRDSRRVDFKTEVNWYEDNKLLKAHFPLDLQTDEATFETQFGHFSRPTHDNTSWDAAEFEVAQQKWLDLSEYGYGVSLLNDCKYGVSVDRTDVGLSLLRATPSPDPEADRGEHTFTYSLLPHQGSFQEAGVIEQSYQLNVPVGSEKLEMDHSTYSLMEIEDPGVIVEGVKRAEDYEDRYLFRIYEAYGRRTKTAIKPGFSFGKAFSVNLIEDIKEELEPTGDKLELEFDPFEIKSVLIEQK